MNKIGRRLLTQQLVLPRLEISRKTIFTMLEQTSKEKAIDFVFATVMKNQNYFTLKFQSPREAVLVTKTVL